MIMEEVEESTDKERGLTSWKKNGEQKRAEARLLVEGPTTKAHKTMTRTLYHASLQS